MKTSYSLYENRLILFDLFYKNSLYKSTYHISACAKSCKITCLSKHDPSYIGS